MSPHELSRRRRLLILAICCMSLFIVGLDSTIVNAVLTSLRAVASSIGPVPNDGHHRATPDAPPAGLRAWQTLRPC
jgi:hypothetical protein